MRQRLHRGIEVLFLGVGLLASRPGMLSQPAFAAGVDPSELATSEKIPDSTEDESETEDAPEFESSEGTAEVGQDGEEGSGKEWPTPLPQKMTIGRDEEVRKHLQSKNWAEAAIMLRSMLDEKPGSFSTAFDLSRALTYLGRREEGLQVLSQLATASGGKRREAIVRRLRVLSELFLTNESYQLYQEGVNLMRTGREKSAQERFSQALRKEPGNIAVMLRLGQCMVADEDYAGASEQLRAAIKLNPFEPELRLWLGRALTRSGERAEALFALESAYRELTGSELAPRWYAEALVLAGKRDRAIEILKADVERNPLHLLSLLGLANIRYSSMAEGAGPNWDVKKDLQVAVSRLPDYSELRSRGPKASLEYVPYPVESIRKDIDALLSQVESRIKSDGE